MIRDLLDSGIKLTHVYIDTVGPPLKYKEKMQRFFPGTNFTITEKADSKYPIVSAASICAKVTRDRIVQNWRYVECPSLHLDAFQLGSGYPADPETKKFLERSLDPVFGFPTLARFSWSTITKILDKDACKCDWDEPDEGEQDQKVLNKQQMFFKNFFYAKNQSNKKVAGKVSGQSRLVAKASDTNVVKTNADLFFDKRSLKRINL